MKLLGVELTPLWVPIERRLQTLAVVFHVSFFMILPIVTYFIAISLFFTSYYWITIGYIAWCIYNYFSKASSLSNLLSFATDYCCLWRRWSNAINDTVSSTVVRPMSQCLLGCWKSNGPGDLLLNHAKISFELFIITQLMYNHFCTIWFKVPLNHITLAGAMSFHCSTTYERNPYVITT